jgi:threonine/homoserine/homoserine lactone efflux protein
MIDDEKTRDPQAGIAYFRRGFIMNVLNPKVALFFLAFLPQFTDPDAGSLALQMTLLGVVFMLQGVIIFTAIALFSGTLGNYLARNPQVARYFAWLSSGIFASLGIRLALSQR